MSYHIISWARNDWTDLYGKSNAKHKLALVPRLRKPRSSQEQQSQSLAD